MAHVRRKATAKTRLNFEIAGIAAIGLAVLLGIALALPPAHAGIVGAATAHGLYVLFGGAAPLFPVLVAFFGGILFLEINVPRLMATLGVAASAYFLVADAAFGHRGGVLGANLWGALQTLLGVAGARIVLILAALLLTVWLSNVSVKKVIGWLVIACAKIRVPQLRVSLPQGHSDLREAFALPKASAGKKEDAPRLDPVAAIVPIQPFIPFTPPVIVVEDQIEDEESRRRRLRRKMKSRKNLRVSTSRRPGRSCIICPTSRSSILRKRK